MSKKAKILSYDKYEWTNHGIFLYYTLDNHSFYYKIKVNSNKYKNIIQDYPVKKRKQLYPYLINTGLGILSFLIKRYYPEVINIKVAKLDKQSISFWKKSYTKGLGEFFFKNKLPHNINLINESNNIFPKIYNFHLNDMAILPNGGGKDSIVSSEILKNINVKYIWVTVGLTSYRKNVINASPQKHYVNISHSRYNKLPTEYKTYKGHMPYTLYTSSLLILLSGLLSKKYIVYSNEKSSSFPNFSIKENNKIIPINHQYTKSFEFEKNYSNFLKSKVNNNMEYFSLLRPLYEIQISKLFSNYTQYHNHFISCNRGRWCGKCSKCAFIYLSLYPYLNKNKLNKIIGNDMLNDINLLDIYKQLLGLEKHKPFECVGTIEENKIIFKKSLDKDIKNKNISLILKKLKDTVSINNTSLLKQYDDNHLIPKELKTNVDKYIKQKLEIYDNTLGSNQNSYYIFGILIILIIILILILLKVYK